MKDGITLKEYLKVIAYIIIGLAMIAFSIMIIFHIFPPPSGHKWWEPALMISGVVMFWVILGGVSFGISWMIKKLRSK